jgi:peptide/nickel transport system permease protein
VAEVVPPQATGRAGLFVRVALSSKSAKVGMALLIAVIAVAFLGPAFAPHSSTAVVGLPFENPGGGYTLGTDALGRDVLSRYLNGGVTLVLVSFAATAIAYLVGVSLGMLAGYRRGALDLGIVGVADLVLSFPPIIFLLALLAAAGPRLSIVVVGIAVTHIPRVVRIVRSVTTEVVTQEYVEAAVARGESTARILVRDVMRNIATPVLADFGLRLSGSIILFSSLSYLGFGQAPPAPNWGSMISENQAGLLLQPWVILVPAATIAVLAIAVNLVVDAVARSLGHSITSRGA